MYYTAHAKQRMAERNISEAEVDEALQNVDKRLAARDQCLNVWGSTSGARRLRITLDRTLTRVITVAGAGNET